MRRALIYLITGSLLAQIGSPAFAQRRGGTGPRGGQAQHYGGARRGATTYQGPRGGTAARLVQGIFLITGGTSRTEIQRSG